MQSRLANRVCLVTGAGARGDGIGNGRATALLFAREGARVLVVDRDDVAAQRTVAMITDEGEEADTFVGDLTDPETASSMAAHAIDRWGRIDVLHNNIGIAGEAGTVTDTPDHVWDQVMSTNVTSMVLASRAVIPSMAAAGSGSIVNISSLSALRPTVRVAYATSKGAIISLTQAMAVQHGHQGIRVNCIAPGPVYTPFVVDPVNTDESRERRRKASLLQREGTAWDVAHAAVYLASDEAAYVTGIVLPVDGGVGLRSPER